VGGTARPDVVLRIAYNTDDRAILLSAGGDRKGGRAIKRGTKRE